MNNEIGTLNWNACDTCKWDDSDGGDCKSFPDPEVDTESEVVTCGNYEKRTPDLDAERAAEIDKDQKKLPLEAEG